MSNGWRETLILHRLQNLTVLLVPFLTLLNRCTVQERPGQKQHVIAVVPATVIMTQTWFPSS